MRSSRQGGLADLKGVKVQALPGPKYGGIVLAGLLLTIIFLMVIKPGGIHTGPIFG
jgi:hypothetical protein